MAGILHSAYLMGWILCIDDDSNDVLLLQRSLIKAGVSHALHHVRSLSEAVEYLQGEKKSSTGLAYPAPDLILTDLAFRGGSGLEFLKWFQSQPQLAHIPVLCVTGSEDPLKREEAQRFGAECVSKTANFDEVVAKVRCVLERRVPSPKQS